jgi:hypothetical protein
MTPAIISFPSVYTLSILSLSSLYPLSILSVLSILSLSSLYPLSILSHPLSILSLSSLYPLSIISLLSLSLLSLSLLAPSLADSLIATRVASAWLLRLKLEYDSLLSILTLNPSFLLFQPAALLSADVYAKDRQYESGRGFHSSTFQRNLSRFGQ